MQAATLAQSYTSPSSSNQFSETFFEPSAYTSSLLAACGESKVCFIYKLVEKDKVLKPFVKKVTATIRHPTKHGSNHR